MTTMEVYIKAARQLALIQDTARGRSPGRQQRELARRLASMQDFADQLRAAGSSQNCAQPAAEWLLDHAEFIEEQGYHARMELREGGLSRLPWIRRSGHTRVEAVCDGYLDAGSGQYSLPSFRAFIDAYQEVSVLSLAEIWSLSLALRCCIFRRLAEVFHEVRQRHDACMSVEGILRSAISAGGRPDTQSLTEALDRRGRDVMLSGAVIAHLVSRLSEWADDSEEVRQWLLLRLDNGSESLSRLNAYETRLQASYQMEAGRLIGSLRAAERTSWEKELETLSLTEQVLRTEASGMYGLLDSESRATLRSAAARLAARLGLPEKLTAEYAVKLSAEQLEAWRSGSKSTTGEVGNGAASAASGGTGAKDGTAASDAASAAASLPHGELPPRAAYAAYYLLEPEGRHKLQQAVSGSIRSRRLPESGLMRRRSGVYLSLLGLFFVVLAVALLLAIGGASGNALYAWGWVLAGVLVLLPASEWAVALLHGLIGRTMPTRPLLRYDFASGVPDDASTMIVIPVIWSSSTEVREMAKRLELHYLANRNDRFHFALLGDFPDAAAEETEDDRVLVEEAAQAIRELNEKYSRPGGTTFHLLQRSRSWNELENVWMGWERKRGKVVEFARLLDGQSATSFKHVESDTSIYSRIAYVITLDADTQLPIGSAQRMVGTMHLPYNAPRLNSSKTRVSEGYAVLQPRIAISSGSASESRLAALWAGNPGIDPYAFAVSDPYQDGVGQGIFTGKGIFHAGMFRELLSSRIPDNTVLSHDLLEGGFLRGGLLSDIELVDGHPATFRSWQMRLHRWVRGDWQLLCWLKRQVRDCAGTPRPVDLGAITRWQIVDNLRRSLMSPGLYFIVLLAPLLPTGTRGALLTVAILTAVLPMLQSLLAPAYLLRHPGRFGSALLQSLLTALTLPYQASLQVDAIFRTLYRTGVSRRKLLEWTSAADTDRASDRRLLAFHSPGALLALIAPTVAFAAGLSGGWLTIYVLVAVLWLAAPLLVTYLNGRPAVETAKPTEEQGQELRGLAASIWAYYADYAGEEDNWLPPDNVQLEPDKGAAHRTSPTNIGLMLACTVTARDFGFISSAEMVERMSRTMDTLEQMERWHGHLFNWYETTTLKPLPPKYVSTVDSGNLVAYLIAARQGVKDHLELEKGSWHDGAVRLMERLETFMQETDFRPLYNSESQLLALGYHADQDRRDEILYDLLASEARQASFLAIAQGQLPASHWFRLGRGLTRIGRRPALLSWSGTMFEYLMPALLMRTYRGSLWDSTYRAVVQRQKDYAREKGVPYGISESGYYGFDYDMNYQYRAFGVPGLGFQRGLEKDLVLAPYAAVMALPWDMEEGMANLKLYEEMGARGKYGFYEAVDLTASRLPEGSPYRVVRSFMAHHQGMSLLTLGNMLLDRSMVERFHADPRVEAAELILQERLPEKASVIAPQALKAGASRSAPVEEARPAREFNHPVTPVPEVCVLSNGSFTSVVTASGSGLIRSEGVSLTRWREEALTDSYGPAVYIRDLTGGLLWSPTFYPIGSEGSGASARFRLDKAEFRRREGGIASSMDIVVAPEHSAELRIITLENESRETRLLEVTTYLELALAPPSVDDAHPAFSKLFVQTSHDETSGALLAWRRPRSPEDKPLWAVHILHAGSEEVGPVEYETDRARFLGRGHSLASPRCAGERLSGSTGAVLDPAFVMRRKIRLEPGERATLTAVSGMAASRGEALQLVRELLAPGKREAASELAWTLSVISLRQHGLNQAEAAAMQKLAGRILYTPPLSRERAEAVRANRLGQSGLWALGLSGDLPIVLLRVGDLADMAFARRMVNGHGYLRRLGLAFDLVLLNESSEGYQQELQDALQGTIQAAASYPPFTVGGGMYPIASSRLSPEQAALLGTAARVSLRADGSSLGAQLRERAVEARGPVIKASSADGRVADIVYSKREYLMEGKNEIPSSITRDSRNAEQDAVQDLPPDGLAVQLVDWDTASHQTRRRTGISVQPLEPEAEDLLFFNGWGGFQPSDGNYVIRLREGHPLAVPWSNVMANPKFGTLVTERGTGYSWWSNSREFKLSPWSNDPVLDAPGELLYVRDEDSGKFWTSSPAPGEPRDFRVEHGKGFSRLLTRMEGLTQEASIAVHPEDAVKVTELRLRNDSDRVRSLSATAYCALVLGVSRESSSSTIVTDWDVEAEALIARNAYQETFQDASAFLMVTPDGKGDRTPADYTCDRREFIGPGHGPYCPAAMGRRTLSGSSGTFADSCASVRRSIVLAPGEERRVYVVLGAAGTGDEAAALARKYASAAACAAVLPAAKKHWQELLGQIEVETPDKEMNLLLNGWLLYQALSCRVWARTAFFQAGGAYGFRDQLQDSLSLLNARPDLSRRQLLLNASHQYEEGDVQHWWHEETHKGIRTKYTDDLLWLPYASARYVVHTGDWDVFSEKAPFITSSTLTEEEHERYEATVLSGNEGTLYEHCMRAIDKGLTSGRHGIPLMGIGDWNDGMNSIGDEGRGESVWLGWFLCVVLEKFAPICDKLGDELRAAHYRKERERIMSALNEHAWDGEWYRRACTDEGKWIGTNSGKECRIDAIAQSWSVISGGAPPERARKAMGSFDRELVDRNLMLARLLTPPFDKTEPSPGYIQGYPPGLRENGAQYTHGVIWSIVAWCVLGEGDKATELYRLLNPVSHAKSPGDVRRYGAEPYVMAADVYTTDTYGGKAGWTWYTGASGWMYQAGLEWILGITREGNELVVRPCIPAEWPSYSVRYRHEGAELDIRVLNPHRLKSVDAVLCLNGERPDAGQSEMRLPLPKEGSVKSITLIMEQRVAEENNSKMHKI
ncbi:GH36-type glycosyl hydrolase domain-containing protein [Paenibacillus herberti]|uniref:Glycosyl transferase family 36 n=1 Tax=Paenibacillus herberti TaxID=1619309 RepID=A0A229P4E5_9BACL|nr:glucoamylase family protein [Paenibacillus herberti]OXM17146.1 glycosyl transferase family 36 [Paenibacillus herberti]